MSALILDVSPMAINKTAMYHVVRDTAMHLIDAGLVDTLVASGEKIPIAEFIANDFALTRVQQDRVGSRIDALVKRPKRAGKKSADDRPVLVFDPLYVLSLPAGTKALVYVLDLTPLTRPRWHNPAVSAAYTSAFNELSDPRFRLLAISASTQRDLWANLGIPESKVRVVHLYNRVPPAQRSTDAARPRSLLFVGSLEARKNVSGLIRAFDDTRLHAVGYTLRIAGGHAWGGSRIKAVAKRTRGVELLGRLTDDELIDEYRTCTALAYPSFFEGFGLPALEALALGIPTLLSDSGALPEVGGDQAIYVDPSNRRSISAGLVQLAFLAENDTDDAIRARVEWAETFSRERYLAESRAVIDDFLAWNPVGTAVAVRPSSAVRTRRRPPNRPRDRRVIASTHGLVPGDSYSLDYLYCLQQEGRLRVSRQAAEVWSSPYNLVAVGRLVAALVRLHARNIMIQSMINEAVARKLHERLES